MKGKAWIFSPSEQCFGKPSQTEPSLGSVATLVTPEPLDLEQSLIYTNPLQTLGLWLSIIITIA